MTKWRYTTHENTINFEENVIFNNHISRMPKDFQKGVASKARREIGKGARSRRYFEKALRNLDFNEFIKRWTTDNNIHYSVITEKGLGFRADNSGLDIWASNKWIGLPDKYSDTLTFMLLSLWRHDVNLRSQNINVELDVEILGRRLGHTWSEKEIKKRIKFLKNNGNLNGQMLSALTFSPELEEVYSYDEMK